MSPQEPEDNRWCALRGEHQPPADAGADALWVSPDGGLTMIEVKRPLNREKRKKMLHLSALGAWLKMWLIEVGGLLAVSAVVIGLLTGNQALAGAGILVAALLGTATSVKMARDLVRSRRTWPRLRASVAAGSVRSLTGLAAFLAGREGPNLLGESAAHLRGESGHDPVTWATVMEAARWVITGVHYRGQDWALAAWKPVDAVLGSRFLSGLFVAIPTVVDAFEVLTHKGAMTVLTSFSSIFGVGVALAAAVRYGRKRREIELPEPKRRARADGQDGQDQ